MPELRHTSVTTKQGSVGDTPSLPEVISALSFALDLTEGAVPGHALRSCLLGMRLGQQMGFSGAQLADLYHALLLKDVGCSSNAARMCQIIGGGDDRAIKFGVKLEDWTKPHRPSFSAMQLLWQTVTPEKGPASKIGQILKIALKQHRNNEEVIQLRCDRGASIVRKLGMSEQTALAVRSLDEHWNGRGYPDRLKGNEISPLARVMAVAQHLDVFAQEQGKERALLTLVERSGRWFDPDIVRAAASMHRQGSLWQWCLPDEAVSPAQAERAARVAVIDIAPEGTSAMSTSHIDLVCEAFAEVVDAKSSFTFRHSLGVTDAAVALGRAMGLKTERRQLLHRAALLHDLGKLRVPNSILDKQGKLDANEWAIVREHPTLTQAILNRVQQFGELAYIAGAHHEKLDGTGYPNNLAGGSLSLEARILTVADIYGALTEQRPYRNGSTPAEALRIMRNDAPTKIDADVFDALTSIAETIGETATAPSTRLDSAPVFSPEPTFAA